MAFSHGKGLVFKIGTAGSPGVTGDISQYIKSVKMPRKKDTADVTALGATNKAKLSGIMDGTMSVDGIWDPTVDAILDALLKHDAADVAFQVIPQAAGPTYSGLCIMTAYDVAGGVGNAVDFTASFEITGTVSRA